jgi:hypothetical protein
VRSSSRTIDVDGVETLTSKPPDEYLPAATARLVEMIAEEPAWPPYFETVTPVRRSPRGAPPVCDARQRRMQARSPHCERGSSTLRPGSPRQRRIGPMPPARMQ